MTCITKEVNITAKKSKKDNWFPNNDKLVDLMVQGAFTAAGSIIGTVVAKYVLKEVDKSMPLPEALHGSIESSTK